MFFIENHEQASAFVSDEVIEGRKNEIDIETAPGDKIKDINELLRTKGQALYAELQGMSGDEKSARSEQVVEQLEAIRRQIEAL